MPEERPLANMGEAAAEPDMRCCTMLVYPVSNYCFAVVKYTNASAKRKQAM